ncbi:MAG: DUF262 domain-containing protein [Armatimonadetes bacterium]|nr:DUF262 domain-containing protein [Armatimonadota bacterium]
MFKVTQHDPRALSWWYSERENIELDPVYQRQGKIWSEKDKSYLIDSILNDYDIPKLYVADFTYGNSPLNETKKSYAVVDGKQRFEAIFDFFDGKLLLDENFEYVGDPSLKLTKLSYRDLKLNHPKIASKFDNYNLTVMSVITDEEGKINDLFVRLNHSKTLTGAEIRNAMRGVVPNLIRRLASHPFFTTKIRFNSQRGQDKNAAAKMLLIEFRGKFVDTKKIHLDRFVEEGLKSETRNFETAAERAEQVLDIMTSIFSDRDILLSKAGPLALYYWLVRNCPAVHRDKVRQFLVHFEQVREENRNRAKSGDNSVDQELLNYDIINRSTDDQGSLIRRYEVLTQRFERFVA